MTDHTDARRRDDWWRTAVIYQIYPRSFADANGDGAVNIKDVTAIQYYAAGNTSQAGNCGKKM